MSSEGEPLASNDGPIERLVEFNQQLFELEAEHAQARRYVLLRNIAISIALIGSTAVFVATTLTWRRFDLGRENRVAIPIILISLFAIVGFYMSSYLQEGNGFIPRKRFQIQLDIDILRERRRLYSASLNLDVSVRQYSYRDGISGKLSEIRREAAFYRRINNFLQTIIIIGSLATSTLAGMSDTLPAHRGLTVGFSFSVGISAGLTGYFKFKEKGFYLQQTGDQVEKEIVAAELGIDPYKGMPDLESLAELAERVENILNEQRKRQQQLDQPTDSPAKQV